MSAGCEATPRPYALRGAPEEQRIRSFKLRVAAVVVPSAVALVVSAVTAVRLIDGLMVCFVPVSRPPALTLCSETLWGHALVPVALLACCIGVVGIWSVCTASTLFKQTSKASRFRRQLSAAETTPEPRAARLAAQLDLRVRVVACPVPVAVTVGMVRPEILLTDSLMGQLNDDELRAVVHHEAWHAAGRHPAAYALLRSMAQGVSVLPVLRSWMERAVLVSEIEADRAAIAAVGRPAFLSALAKLAEAADPLADSKVAYGSARGMLTHRVRVLAGQRLSWAHTPRELWQSLLGALLLAAPALGLLIATARARL